ncbi:MAG: hypothetical protein D6712_01835 [Chloroflexi bacterium]|nr:MAG: hypothetical protein D6712_01835 [Chloroflexota bacterium]
MSQHPLDAPLVLENLFFPRKARPSSGNRSDTFDGMIPVAQGVILGYRLYARDKKFPVTLYFHGNGEIATDFDNIALMYHMAGTSLLVVDYRGYGWSTGEPRLSTLATDAEVVVQTLSKLLSQHGIENAPLYIKGRSLGSAPAIHAAYKFPQMFRGLIIESGYADAPSLFRRFGLTISPELLADDNLPLNNVGKLAHISLPLLILHGEEDRIIPVTHGRRLYDVATTADKTLEVIHGAGHNNLLTIGMERYFAAIRDFIARTLA